jgi:RNA polymerase sigma factor (sigma-70 family)
MQAGADEGLIEASRRGDRDAFAQIVVRYQRPVYAVAFAGVRDRALADDVVQDTFVIAWRRLGELRDASRLPAWLCGIARNRARELRRRAQRETATELGDVQASTTPFEELTDAQSEALVAAALGCVPDVYREPLVLFYYEERSVADVARSLGITTATTNKRLSRGRQFLAERVAMVERALLRRGPAPGLAASVAAAIALHAPGLHVETTAVKGSIMHKLAIAAIATLSVGGAGALVISATRSDAHAAPHPTTSITSSNPHVAAGSTTAHVDHSQASMAALFSHVGQKPALGGAHAVTATMDNDCAAVGQHLADLQADVTHGANARPEDDSYDHCAATYQANCETEHWSVDRRNCTLGAGDLINAHLCAGHIEASAPPTTIPANLACDVLGPQVAATLQAGGFHKDVPDLGDQISAACDVGSWTIELRTCFAGATSVDALKSCLHVE